MPTFIFQKLVRDNLLQIYRDLQQQAEYVRLEGAELQQALQQKLQEEVVELLACDATDREAVQAELADIAQVLQDMGIVHTTSAEVEAIRARKYAKKGGFEKGIFVETITLNPDDPWVDYYRNEPEKYPER